MNTIDRASLRRLTDKIDAALSRIGEEEGLTIRTAGCSFTAANARLRVDIATRGEAGEVHSREAVNLALFGPAMGLTGVKVGTAVTIRGEVFRVVGLKPRSTRYPVLAEKGGRVYKLGADSVARALGLPPPPATLDREERAIARHEAKYG